jgi:hypothetical protein
MSILQELVYSNDYDIICLCETWLNDSVLNNELLPGYSIHRRDRQGQIGGGVLVAVRTNIESRRREDLERENIELIAVEIHKSGNKPLLLYTFYRPPQSPPNVLNQLNSSLQDSPESSCIVLLGDFNLPTISWSENQSAPLNARGLVVDDIFCNFVDDNFLHQFIKGPTHITGNKLDLLLCNHPEVIENVTAVSPEEHNFPTDHHII